MSGVAGQDRAALVKGLRKLARPASAPPIEFTPEERCELCPTGLAEDHRHLLHLDERRIVCVCETCWSLRSGDAEYRPAGGRTLWLADFDLPDDIWAAFGVPIGLAFFLRNGASGVVAGLYPSPAGATESELSLDSWDRLVELNPILERLDPDCEALIVNRLSEPHEFAIAPIDVCYKLVGLIKANWEGISGGDAVERAVPEFFGWLKAKATKG